MATVKKGTLTASAEYKKHLRTVKRVFWRKERRTAKQQCREQLREHDKPSSGRSQRDWPAHWCIQLTYEHPSHVDIYNIRVQQLRSGNTAGQAHSHLW